jgi:hypothetical protein
MSHFKPVKFEVSESPGRPERPKTKLVINSDKLEPAIKKIQEEFELIRTGASEYTTYAIDNGAFGSPVGNALKILESKPSVDNVKRFLQAATQDVGIRASNYFKELLTPTVEEVEND